MKTHKATNNQMETIRKTITDATWGSEIKFSFQLTEEKVEEMIRVMVEQFNALVARYDVDDETRFFLLNYDVALYGFFFENDKWEVWHLPKIKIINS